MQRVLPIRTSCPGSGSSHLSKVPQQTFVHSFVNEMLKKISEAKVTDERTDIEKLFGIS